MKTITGINPAVRETRTDNDGSSLWKENETKRYGNDLPYNRKCPEKKITGYEAWILSSNRQALKWVGLRPSGKYELNHGGLKVVLQKFHIQEKHYSAKYSNKQKKL